MCFVDRNRLAADHRFVDEGVPGSDRSIDWNLLARPHHDQVVDGHVFDGNFGFCAVTDDPSRARLQSEQFLDRLGRALLRAFL